MPLAVVVVAITMASSFNLSNTSVVTAFGLVRALQLGLQLSANVGLKEAEQPSAAVRSAPDATAFFCAFVGVTEMFEMLKAVPLNRGEHGDPDCFSSILARSRELNPLVHPPFFASFCFFVLFARVLAALGVQHE